MTAPPIHSMQGRLVPPVGDRIQAFPADAWENELRLAPGAGISGIEWIYEVYGADVNPLASDEGLARLRAASGDTGIAVESACADWFMDRPLLRCPDDERGERVAHLAWLVHRAAAAGVARIVLPFVDASAITDEGEALEVAEIISGIMSDLEAARVELHLETSLPPGQFAALLTQLDHPWVKANYDSGNSASLGYDPREEFAAYGDRIGSVHIKDRVLGGGTVPLGEGDADIPATLSLLRGAGWDRPLVLQTARGRTGDEVAKVAGDVAQVHAWWEQA